MSEYAIELKNVSKSFGKVIANKNINLSVKKGEILSLLGENGSGKTTLMNMISGIYYPDEGQIFVNGQEVVIMSPMDAFKYKIGMIHQHFKLVDIFTAAENIVLGVAKSTFDVDSAVKGMNKKLKDCGFKSQDLKVYLKEGIDEGIEFFDCQYLNKILKTIKDQAKIKIENFEGVKGKEEILSLIESELNKNGLIKTDLDAFIKDNEYDYKKASKLFKAISKSFRYSPFRNRYNIKEVNSRVVKITERYGFDIDPKKKIHEMSVSEKQTVEIMKVLFRGADVLILDEPTAVLTPQEIKKLFDVLRIMKKYGKSVIIITHKLNEVMEISDRVAILRKGEYIGTVETKDTNEKQLTEMMVGKKIELKIDRPEVNMDKPLLEIRDLNILGDDGSKKIEDVSFYIRGGEILGVAGIAGCGQKELCEAIAGLRKLESGFIMHKGESIVGLPAKKIIEKGVSMSFIPEDRLGMGLAPSFSITDNMMLKTYGEGRKVLPKIKEANTNSKFKNFFIKVGNFFSIVFSKVATFFLKLFVDRKTARKKAQALIEKLEVVTPSTETPVRRLSGGNVQKVLVGREIESAPNVIITAYPVRGLDINSSYAIYDILNEQKKKGTGILFIGEDLDVMLGLCDKIMVLCHGKNMGIVHANKTTKEDLGLMMTGSLDLTEVKKDKEYGKAKDSNLSEEEWKKAEEEQQKEMEAKTNE